jgi:wyosine [tRNA(Phe)-imidazoG37] synthetase (radical SAM superfamily)
MGDEAVLELIRAVDSVSISLNASAADEYRRICRPSLENAWEHLMKFIRLVRQAGVKATLTAVKGSGADIPRVESMAGRLGLPFRVR